MISWIRVVSFLGLLYLGGFMAACESGGERQSVFVGEEDFDNFTKNYKIDLEEAKDKLEKHLKASEDEYWYFPFQVIYAFDGGYLFVNGEFKNHIKLKGYFVTKEGDVVFRDLQELIDIKDYKGVKKEKRPGTVR